MKRYIDKDALVAEIERQISAIDNYPKLTDTLNIQIAVLEGNKVVLTKYHRKCAPYIFNILLGHRIFFRWTQRRFK